MREDIKINDRALALEDQIVEVLKKFMIQNCRVRCIQSWIDLRD